MQDGHQPQAFGLPPLLGRCPISLFSLLLSLYADSLLLGTFSFTSFSSVYSVAPELLCFHSSHVLPSGLWPPNAPQQVLRMAPARFLSCALQNTLRWSAMIQGGRGPCSTSITCPWRGQPLLSYTWRCHRSHVQLFGWTVFSMTHDVQTDNLGLQADLVALASSTLCSGQGVFGRR